MRRDAFWKAFAVLAAAGATGSPLRPARAAGSIRMTIPASRGSVCDRVGRALGSALKDAGIASSVGYDNRDGAAGTTGLAYFVGAARGERGALIVTGTPMLGGIITNRPPVDLSQTTPIARLVTRYDVFVLPANSPLRTMADVVARLRRDPAGVRWGGGARGSTAHIAAALIAGAVGADASKIDHVALGSDDDAAAAALLAGSLTIAGGDWRGFAPYLASGQLRAVGVSSARRLAGRDVPTLREQGIDVVIGDWHGVHGAPAITEMERRQLIADVIRATETKAWLEALQENAWTPALLTGDDFGRFVDAESVRLRDVLHRLGLV